LRVVSKNKDAFKAASSRKNLIYNEKNGILYFNENGRKEGWGEGGEFVKLLGGPELSKADVALL